MNQREKQKTTPLKKPKTKQKKSPKPTPPPQGSSLEGAKSNCTKWRILYPWFKYQCLTSWCHPGYHHHSPPPLPLYPPKKARKSLCTARKYYGQKLNLSISEVQYLIGNLAFPHTPTDQCKLLVICKIKHHAISRSNSWQTAQAFDFHRRVDVDFCSSSSKIVINWKLFSVPVPRWIKSTKQHLVNIFALCY